LNNNASRGPTALARYLQLAVLIVAAGGIYPLLYLRQNFEITMLDAFGIDISQLNQCYSLLGALFVITYVPSGWLADRLPPRLLMCISLALAGSLGIWFAAMPDFQALRIIFAGWGIATGLTFWAALIKATSMLAHHDEQGRFFGLLDGGRGLVEAILATAAVALFAWLTRDAVDSTADALRSVIWLYVSFMLLLSPLVYLVVKPAQEKDLESQRAESDRSLIADVRMVLGKAEVWLVAICILTAYQLFWSTYAYSGYMQTHYGLSAVTVGSITVAKLWMRPIGAATAGFASDFFSRERVLAVLMLLTSGALFGLVALPVTAGTVALLGMVMVIGILIYAVRGIYWATLDSCGISNRVKGLAIGIISLLGYSPDVYLPLVNNAIFAHYPGKPGYNIYFSVIAAMGVLGACAAWALHLLVRKNPRQGGD